MAAKRKKLKKKKRSSNLSKRRNTLVDKIVKIVRTYKRVMIVFNSKHNNESNRRRIIKRDGFCKVNYTISEWDPILRKHTLTFASDSFTKCCFLDYKPKGKSLRDTVKRMTQHDKESGLKPYIIYYGRKFSKGMEFK